MRMSRRLSAPYGASGIIILCVLRCPAVANSLHTVALRFLVPHYFAATLRSRRFRSLSLLLPPVAVRDDRVIAQEHVFLGQADALLVIFREQRGDDTRL